MVTLDCSCGFKVAGQDEHESETKFKEHLDFHLKKGSVEMDEMKEAVGLKPKGKRRRF